jgi:chromosome partitioning protein
MSAAKVADLILIPCRPAAFDLDAIGTTLNLAQVVGKSAFVLLNAVPSQGRVGEEARAALTAGGVSVADPLLHHLVAFSHAINDGRSAQEFDPKGKAAGEIATLFDWTVKRINEQTCLRATNKTSKQNRG